MNLVIMLFVLILGFRDLATVVTDHLTNLKVNLSQMRSQLVEALVSAVTLNTHTLMVGGGSDVNHDLLNCAVGKVTLSTIKYLVSC